MYGKSSETNVLFLNEANEKSNFGKDVVELINDLLLTVNNLVAGIAFISNNTKSNRCVEYRIQVSSNHPVVILHYELNCNNNFCSNNNHKTATVSRTKERNSLVNDSSLKGEEIDEVICIDADTDHDSLKYPNVPVSQQLFPKYKDGDKTYLPRDSLLLNILKKNDGKDRQTKKNNLPIMRSTKEDNMQSTPLRSSISNNILRSILSTPPSADIPCVYVDNESEKISLPHNFQTLAMQGSIFQSASSYQSEMKEKLSKMFKYNEPVTEKTGEVEIVDFTKNSNGHLLPRNSSSNLGNAEPMTDKVVKQENDGSQNMNETDDDIEEIICCPAVEFISGNGHTENDFNAEFAYFVNENGENVHLCSSGNNIIINGPLEKFKCAFCDKSFHQGTIWKKIKRHQCSFCNKSFTRRSSKVIHERIHTGERPFSCSYCEKTFISSDQKSQHERTHTGEKPYSCRYCGKAFSQGSSRKLHEKIHTGEKSYSCRFCEKTFIRMENKRRHEKIHTGKKAYLCTYCGKAFIQLSDKTRHEKTHLTSRYFVCNFCDKVFNRLVDKTIHERSHKREKSFTCKYCGRTFNQLINKNRHEAAHERKKNI